MQRLWLIMMMFMPPLLPKWAKGTQVKFVRRAFGRIYYCCSIAGFLYDFCEFLSNSTGSGNMLGI